MKTISQLAGHQRLVSGKHGVFVYNLHCFYCGRALELYGEYCEHEVQLFSKIVQKGDTVWEIGANIGALAVPLAGMVGNNGCLVAFEPQPEVFNNLAANFALNCLGWARALPFALGERPGIVTLPRVFYDRPGNFGGISLMDSSGGGERVECRRGDDLSGFLPKPDFVKIDVEGMEAGVLRGMSEMINSAKPVLYVENDRPEKSQHLVELLWSFGYQCWWHIAAYFNADNHFGLQENLYPDQVAVNMLCMHPGNQRIQITDLPISNAAEHPFSRN
ncbi:FkbM family methyltransferase [Chlorobium ferrooxidans]|nr:FkbM family methyltransferase [Chlorobium ferrooxidans]